MISVTNNKWPCYWEMDGFGSCEHMGRVGRIEGRGMLLPSGSGLFSRMGVKTIARNAREVLRRRERNVTAIDGIFHSA
jgi:hypothetical protein